MKKIALLCLLMNVGILHAQTLVDSALRYNMPAMTYPQAVLAKQQQLRAAHPTDTSEGSEVNEFTRRASFMAKYFCGNAPADSEAWLPAARTTMSVIMQPDAYCIGGGGNWKCLGPFNNNYGGYENQGRANSVWVCPTDTNYILAATYGGLWKSRNGGLTWHNISDGISVGYTGNQIPGTMGMVSLAVDPLNSNNIYVYLADWSGMGIGAAYSNDSGDHWYFDAAFNSLAGFSYFTGQPHLKMMYMPGTEKLFAYLSDSTGQKSTILVKPNSSAAWQNITPTLGIDSLISDMEFTIASPGKVVFSTNAADDTAHLWTYDTATTAWTNLNVTMPAAGDIITGIDDISLSATDTVYMFAEVKNEHQHLIKTPLSPANISVISNNVFWFMSGTDTVSWSMQYLVVNPVNPQIMYCTLHNGGENFYQSVNGGTDFQYYGGTGGIQGSTHADARYITLYAPTTSTNGINDVLYGATDGGVVKKRYGNPNFESITGDSLCITQFFGMSNMEGEDDLMMGGAQDNGAFTYRKNRPSQWNSVFSSDSQIPIFAGNGVKKGIYEYIEPGSPSSPEFQLGGIDFSTSTDTYFGVNDPGDTCNEAYWSNLNNNIRPWYVDKNNNLYIGERTVWKSTDFGVTWNDLFGTRSNDPINMSNCPKVNSICIAEPDTDMVYVAYRDMAYGGPTTNPKLFLTSQATSSNPNWTNITPSQVQWWPIENIETDPQQPGRIWVALGGADWGHFKDSAQYRHNRLLYSPNYGQNWCDVSRGLPPLAVNKIKYRHGSNDQLYCATALGVYYCDFSTFNPADTPFYGITWECFNDGLPACNITDMEFNYCAKKLRVSTFGRGIWETDLGNPWDIVAGGDTITTNTTWTTDKYITGAIVIEPGAELDMNSITVHMPKNGVIIVEPGGKLVVNGSKITNECEGCMWFGIEALGNGGTFSPQNDFAHHARVQITNSVIENARYAVSNCDRWNSDTATGGAIWATNSVFLNNHVSVSFYGYHNYDVSGLHDNLSGFSNCTFLLDNGYKGNSWGYPFWYHSFLSDVDGVAFSGCQFLNRYTTTADNRFGEGIHAVDGGGFYVARYCSGYASAGTGSCIGGSWIPSRFSGFGNAISIQGVYSADIPISIDQADFDSCSVGVNVSAENNTSTTLCNFKIGHGVPMTDITEDSTNCGQNIGILIQNAYNFRMEGNNFIGSPPQTTYWHNFGAVVANTCTSIFQQNKVYLNSFDSLTYGVYAIGENRTTGGGFTTGLQVLCNTFGTDYTDIQVAPDGLIGQGIAQYQGGYTGGAYITAGNTFSNSTNRFINNSGAINYYYDTSNATAENPHLSSPNIATATNYTKSCSSTLNTGGSTGLPVRIDPGVLETYKGAFFSNKEAWRDSMETYNSLIDMGGLTYDLISAIDTTTDSASLALLYDTCISHSPYLSQAVVQEFFNVSKWPDSEVVSLLVLNPDNLHNGDFLAAMVNYYTGVDIQNDYTTDYTDTVLNAAQRTTPRTSLEAAINISVMAACDDANVIMMSLRTCLDTAVSVNDTTGAGICTDSTSVYYMRDSNSYYFGLDSLDTWVQNLKGFWPQNDRVGYYNYRGQYDVADSIFQSLNPNNAVQQVGTGTDSTQGTDTTQQNNMGNTAQGGNTNVNNADQAYAKIWKVLYKAEKDGRNILRLDSMEIAKLDTTSVPVFTPFIGQQLLRNVTVNLTSVSSGVFSSPPYTVPCILSNASNYRTAPPPPKKPVAGNLNTPVDGIKKKAGDQFTVYPNPANGTVTFAYNIPQANGDIRIVVTNILGEKVMELHTGNNTGKSYWDASHQPTGVYFYQANSEKSMISKGKIVVAR
ncbi:MAG: T9SS type A sorting domain-containing protein [Chitinophagales bacterium]